MSEGQSTSSYRIELLKGDNWMPWKHRMLAILWDLGLEKYVVKTASPPTPADPTKPMREESEDQDKWREGGAIQDDGWRRNQDGSSRLKAATELHLLESLVSDEDFVLILLTSLTEILGQLHYIPLQVERKQTDHVIAWTHHHPDGRRSPPEVLKWQIFKCHTPSKGQWKTEGYQ